MKLNKIQQAIFKKLAKERSLELNRYIALFAREYIKRDAATLKDLSEAEGDAWINKAYLESLEK